MWCNAPEIPLREKAEGRGALRARLGNAVRIFTCPSGISTSGEIFNRTYRGGARANFRDRADSIRLDLT